MVTLKDVMNSPLWPKCEHCQKEPAAWTFTLGDTDFPAYGVPPWCSSCLEVVPWEVYYMAQAKAEYQAGVHARRILANLFGSRKYS